MVVKTTVTVSTRFILPSDCLRWNSKDRMNVECCVKSVGRRREERLRGEAWRILLDVEKMKTSNKGEYEKMK